LAELCDFSSGLSKPSSEFGYGYPFVSFKDVFHNYFLPEQLKQKVNSTLAERENCSIKRDFSLLKHLSAGRGTHRNKPQFHAKALREARLDAVNFAVIAKEAKRRGTARTIITFLASMSESVSALAWLAATASEIAARKWNARHATIAFYQEAAASASVEGIELNCGFSPITRMGDNGQTVAENRSAKH
jgi:hypothetical protein